MLDDRAKNELDRLAGHLQKHPELRIELSSHTDSRGNDAFNTTLSFKRSEAAKTYLVSKGIKSKQIFSSWLW